MIFRQLFDTESSTYTSSVCRTRRSSTPATTDYKGRAVTSIGEEKRHNPRLSGKSREEFIHIMANLHLPKPRKMDLAVPANRACGHTAPSPQGAGAPCPAPQEV